jgi:hypothetical protein
MTQPLLDKQNLQLLNRKTLKYSPVAADMNLVYYKEDVFNHEEWMEEFLRNLVFETIFPNSIG